MAKSQKLEDTLAALHQLRDDPTSGQALAQLRGALGGKSSHAAAKAAHIAAEFEISQLTVDMIAAFDRFMLTPVKADPGCSAKAAIAEALYRIGADAVTVFLRGIRHVQMEPVYGGRVDTACELRGVCALGLVRMNYPDALIELADLLADPQPSVRAAAAAAMAYSEDDHNVPLLRFKILSGDVEPEVISECFAAVLKLAPASSLPFVGRFLDSDDDDKRAAAALALGGSRLREAFDVLKQWWERTPEPGLRRTALLAIAMLRQDRAIDFLLSVIADGSGPNARDAIAALGLYRHDETVCARVRHAAAAREDLKLGDAVAKAFGTGDG